MFKEGITEPALKTLDLVAQSGLADKFYLAGGTAAAIQMGHRLSVDLDFFCPELFESDDIVSALKAAGVPASKLQPSKGTLHCVIQNTKVSFLQYEYPLLGNMERFEKISLASLLDIGLMKITAIASRGMRKDFIDLYFIMQKVPLQHLLNNFSEKYPSDKLDPYHYLKSLTYFDDADDDPMPHMLKVCDWLVLKQSLERSVSMLSLR